MEARTHKLGDVYRHIRDGEFYILAYTGSDKACLICIDDGDKWTEPRPVEITPESEISHRDFVTVTVNCSDSFEFVGHGAVPKPTRKAKAGLK